MSQQPLPEGICFTLYNGKYPDRALTPHLEELLRKAQPQIVMVHAGPRALMGTDPDYRSNKGAAVTIARVRELLPAVRTWAGVGLDGCTAQIAQGKSVRVERTLTELRGWCVDQGMESVCWDSEAAGKEYPQAGEEVARMAVRVFRAVPIVQSITTYGVPVRVKNLRGQYDGGHAPYRFAPWHDKDGADVTIPQKYASPKSGLAAPGALLNAIETSNRSYKRLEELGLARPNMPNWDYYQFHHTPYQQLVTYGATKHIVCAWVSKSIDSQGEIGLTSLSKLRHLYPDSRDAVRDFQRSAGLAADGVFGPKTLAALLA